jgi:hypothetical protein
MKTLLYFILFLTAANSYLSQNYFQKICKLNDTMSIFNDINIFHEDTVLLSGTSGLINSHFVTSLCYINRSGSINNQINNTKPPLTQFACFSSTNSQFNKNDNLIFCFSNYKFPYNSPTAPRILEVNKAGEVIFDTTFYFFYDDSIYLDRPNLLYNNVDSCHYIYFYYKDDKTDDNPNAGFQGETGVIVLKINSNYEIKWNKKIRFEAQNIKTNLPGYSCKLNDFSFLFVVKEFLSYGGTTQDWGKTHFYTLDTAGTILSHKEFQDTQYDISGNAYLPLPNGDIIATYFESQLTGTGAIQYYEHRPLITRLDSNLNQLWKDTLGNFFGNYAPYNSPSKILLVNDSTMVYAYENIILLDGPNYVAMRLESRNLNGTVNWQREYQYYDEKTEYQILDVEKFSNDDLIFAGQVINYDLINQNKSGQNGYVLKTNCFGFMEDPQANFSYTVLDSNKVQFVNLSAQAGSYSWHFGDGTLLQTGEKVDSVFHTFSKDSIFSVQLIAHGCNAIADTFSINLDFQKTDSVPPNFESLLTVYPNPLGSEELLTVYVGAISSKKHSLVLLDALGKKVATYLVPKANMNLSFDVPAATGIYFLNLVEEDKVLVSRKVVVE